MNTNNDARVLKTSQILRLCAVAGAVAVSHSALGNLVINPTFTAAFNSNFGANAAAAQASWIAAANVFSANFSDNITVNITVDAVSGTSVFGQSNTSLLGYNWSTLRSAVAADAKTANDNTALGAGGSLTVADPSGGSEWWVSRSEAKALGLIASDSVNDGTTTFGAGNPFTFSGPIAAGTYDFKGIAEHEISEVLGRLGISGGTVGSFANSYSLIDAFAYTGANTRNLGTGAGVNFSINNGTTLLKLWNNANLNSLDTRDWAPGSNDAFNQYSNSGVVNGITPVDLTLLDVLGYDLIPVPEPGVGALLVAALGAAAVFRKRFQS